MRGAAAGARLAPCWQLGVLQWARLQVPRPPAQPVEQGRPSEGLAGGLVGATSSSSELASAAKEFEVGTSAERELREPLSTGGKPASPGLP